MATRPRRLDLDTLLNDLTRAAFAVLAAWSLVGLYGTLGGYLEVNRPATLRFLLAVLILVFSHHALVRVRERRLRRLHPDERYGFGEVVEGIPTGPQQTDG
jgi:hypothetical protein